MKKVGMILEGGGQRGIFTSGVLDYFMEKKLKVPYVLGVSAGACNAVDYVSGQILRTKECMLDAQMDYELYGFHTMMKTKHFMNMDLIFDDFPNRQYPFDYEAFAKSPMRCVLEATNCITGRPAYIEEYKDRQRLMDACRASSSLPFAASPVMVDGIPMMDGGISDSVPIRKAIREGYDSNIVILTRPRGYRKKEKPDKTIKLAKMYYRKYPGLSKALLNRNYVYNRTMELLEHLEERGRVFLICPSAPTVKRTEKDLEKLEDFYWHGYEEAKRLYPSLKEWLKQQEECISKKRYYIRRSQGAGRNL
ncbi:MAG TPA: patatin family protein [Candidatus Choladousia intestinigallinarum]|nr:patatin family protein [Candidatus Choladousia intestinigallinarum]